MSNTTVTDQYAKPFSIEGKSLGKYTTLGTSEVLKILLDILPNGSVVNVCYDNGFRHHDRFEIEEDAVKIYRTFQTYNENSDPIETQETLTINLDDYCNSIRSENIEVEVLFKSFDKRFEIQRLKYSSHSVTELSDVSWWQ